MLWAFTEVAFKKKKTFFSNGSCHSGHACDGELEKLGSQHGAGTLVSELSTVSY